jgi:TRAP-type C4-dicarboxylate transport system substrate-binding protein
VREIVARHINEAAVNERTDVEALNATVRGELESNGMEVNEPDTASFRQKLADAGFYAEWKKAYGDDAWAILEKAVGSSLG